MIAEYSKARKPRFSAELRRDHPVLRGFYSPKAQQS